jgi:hypothetical protein
MIECCDEQRFTAQDAYPCGASFIILQKDTISNIKPIHANKVN